TNPMKLMIAPSTSNARLARMKASPAALSASFRISSWKAPLAISEAPRKAMSSCRAWSRGGMPRMESASPGTTTKATPSTSVTDPSARKRCFAFTRPSRRCENRCRMKGAQGRVEAIYIAAVHGELPHEVDEAVAHAGRGIVGDRNFDDMDSCHITLIEAE